MNNECPAVSFDDVSCRIGNREVLSHISLDIARGSITGILGPNGAGKTSLLSIVLGLRRHSAGKVIVLGEGMPGAGKDLRKRIGAVLQETALYDELTAYENLLFSASLYGIPKPKKRISELLEFLGLEERSGVAVKTLSGGMRRRVTIARALLHNPDLLVVDEPTLGVDAEARHAIWSYLRLLKKEGTTILAATNYIDEAQAICDTVSVIRTGRIIATETPGALIENSGCCIDIECADEISEKIMPMMERKEGLVRLEKNSVGLSIFIKGVPMPEKIVLDIMNDVPITGFRIRPPDLAEVFKFLEENL